MLSPFWSTPRPASGKSSGGASVLGDGQPPQRSEALPEVADADGGQSRDYAIFAAKIVVEAC